jgi:CheY-like chemotaxis protein
MSKSCILHIDDDPNDQFLFNYAYETAGIDLPLKQVNSGEEAFAYLEGHRPYIDREDCPLPCLVIADLKMTGASGLDVLKRIRQHPEWRSTVVILLSSSTMPGDIDRAMHSGANAFVTKPAGIEQFREFLESVKAFWLRFHEFGWNSNCRSKTTLLETS